jgi:dihydrofolate reductase
MLTLLGRVTYDGFAEAWPSREGPCAAKLNGDPKYVVSRTLTDPQWANTSVISGDVVAGISKLKQGTDGIVLVSGSGTLVGTLLEADLVDELRLMVFPTILGRGRRLFPDGIDRLKLRLAESKPVGTDGVVLQVYTRPAWGGPGRCRRRRLRWPGQDSNLRATDYESAALTTELPGRGRRDASTGSGRLQSQRC